MYDVYVFASSIERLALTRRGKVYEIEGILNRFDREEINQG